MNSSPKSGATKSSRKKRPATSMMSRIPIDTEPRPLGSGCQICPGRHTRSLIHDPEREAFENLRSGLHGQIAPATPLENDIFTKLIHAAWNLRRLRGLEESLFLTHDDPFTVGDAAPRMLTYHRYAARFERDYRQAICDLRQLQTGRALTLQFTQSAPVTLTALADITKLLEQVRRERPDTAHPASVAADQSGQGPENPLHPNDLLYNVLTRRSGTHPARLPNPPPIPKTTKTPPSNHLDPAAPTPTPCQFDPLIQPRSSE